MMVGHRWCQWCLVHCHHQSSGYGSIKVKNALPKRTQVKHDQPAFLRDWKKSGKQTSSTTIHHHQFNHHWPLLLTTIINHYYELLLILPKVESTINHYYQPQSMSLMIGSRVSAHPSDCHWWLSCFSFTNGWCSNGASLIIISHYYQSIIGWFMFVALLWS